MSNTNSRDVKMLPLQVNLIVIPDTSSLIAWILLQWGVVGVNDLSIPPCTAIIGRAPLGGYV